MSDPALGMSRAAESTPTVLRYRAFRRLWVALSLASLGDWLGLLALTALAQSLSGGGYAAANIAIAGVFILRLLPAIVLGAFAGVVADRLDRRTTMVVANLFRGAVLASIPLVGRFWWLFVATFLLESASLFFLPAKEATVPNLVPRERLEAANQLNLITTYGSAPVAAGIFAGLSLLSGVLDNTIVSFQANPAAVAIWFNAVTFVVSGLLIAGIPDFPSRQSTDARSERIWRTMVDGWSFIGRTPLVRGLVVGMLGAFAAGGAVVGLARTYVRDLGAGDPGYGVLFGVVFLGMAAGMGIGPRLFRGFSRRRLFGVSIAAAGACLALLALIPNMVIAVALTFTIGAWAGVAWVNGYTLLGLEVADDVRGRTFAFVQTMVRVTLVAVLALAPLLAAALGTHELRLADVRVSYNGAAITFLLAGLLAIAVGVESYREMDDRRGVPLWADLLAALRHVPIGPPRGHTTGVLLALEGGEGVGKSTQAELLAARLRGEGHYVTVTREPGATAVGRQLRQLLLDPATGGISARAEALLYAADRAEHVASVVRPALERGGIVITDRYIDSSMAYQGAGRVLAQDDVMRISRWATDGLFPDLTVVLDLPAQEGLARRAGPGDRLESEPVPFHQRVREEFLRLARRRPDRYLVVDATLAPAKITELVYARLERLLPTRAHEAPREKRQRRGGATATATTDEEAERRAAARRRAQARTASKNAQREAGARVAARRAERKAEQAARKRAVQEAKRQAELAARQRAEAAEQARRVAREQAAAEQRAREQTAAEQRARERARVDAAALAQAREREQARARQQPQARQQAQAREQAQARGQATAQAAEVAEQSRPASLADDLFAWAGEDDAADRHLRGPR